jgi:hypothetical protein
MLNVDLVMHSSGADRGVCNFVNLNLELFVRESVPFRAFTCDHPRHRLY